MKFCDESSGSSMVFFGLVVLGWCINFGARSIFNFPKLFKQVFPPNGGLFLLYLFNLWFDQYMFAVRCREVFQEPGGCQRLIIFYFRDGHREYKVYQHITVDNMGAVRLSPSFITIPNRAFVPVKRRPIALITRNEMVVSISSRCDTEISYWLPSARYSFIVG